MLVQWTVVVVFTKGTMRTRAVCSGSLWRIICFPQRCSLWKCYLEEFAALGCSLGDGLKLSDKIYLVYKLNYVKHSSYWGLWWVSVCSLGPDSHWPRQDGADIVAKNILVQMR